MDGFRRRPPSDGFDLFWATLVSLVLGAVGLTALIYLSIKDAG